MFLSVHDEGPVVYHRFVYWVPRNQHKSGPIFTRHRMDQVLAFGFLEHAAVVCLELVFLSCALILGFTFIDVDYGVPVLFYWDLELPVLGNFDIHVVGRCVILYRSCVSFPLSANNFYFGPLFLENWDLVFGELLILGLLHFVLRLEVKP